MQINHKDDNKDNNNINNLYAGTQKDNIQDCIKNNHRVGNIKEISVLDKNTNKITHYNSYKEFIDQTNHTCQNGSLKRMSSRNWFKERYEIIS